MLIVNEEHLDCQRAHLPSSIPTSSFWHKEPSPALFKHRTTPKLPKTADVIVIGSGLSGAFAAMKLLEESTLNVLMLEAREACWGATGRNGGHCQPQLYDNPMDVVAFENRNFETIDALIRKNDISCEWQQMQGCHAFFSKVEFEEAKKDIIELQKRSPVLGSSVRIIENKEELTDLKIPTALGAVVQARAAKLSPYKLVSSILEKLIRTSNLNLQTSTPVLSLTPEISGASSWSVLTSRGSVSASNVIFTTNGYTGYLVSQLQSCIVPVRGEMSALQAPNSLLQQPLSYTYRFIGGSGQTKEQNDYLVQRPVSTDGDGGGELMFGGGRFKALHEGVKVDNDSTIDAPVAEYLRERLLHILDIEESAKVSTESLNKEKELVAKGEWTGIMGFSRDGYPWVGAVPDAPGLWLSAGYNGSGMPNAALSSQHTASLILAASKGKDWRAVERSAVQNGVIPSSYIITKERMEQVRGRFLKL